jgi:hypothetical protein
MARITRLMKKWNYIAVRLYEHWLFMLGGDGWSCDPLVY